MPNSTVTNRRRGKNNKRRGKHYERIIADAIGGKRNINMSQPHTDVETDDAVYEIKSTQASVPVWIQRATDQLELASKETNKAQGGVIKVFTGGGGRKARAFLIKEISLNGEGNEI